VTRCGLPAIQVLIAGALCLAVLASGIDLIDGLARASAIGVLTGAGSLFASAALLYLGCTLSQERQRARALGTQLAVTQERQRLARELHDGVAQDLAFIASQSAHLARSAPEQEVLGHIAGAAKRALTESRSVINGLADEQQLTIVPQRQSLALAVTDRARELGSRAGIEVHVDADADVIAPADVDHAVMRIITEAISNTAKHAAASKLWISLRADDDSLIVRVFDNGCGFAESDVARTELGGFGLNGMRERMEDLGGALRLSSEVGAGTLVEADFSLAA
jgi:signal transduction histidine kinase